MQVEKSLDKLLTLQKGGKQNHFSLTDWGPDRELTCIAKYGFKPANQVDIYSAIQSLVMSDRGIVRMFQNQMIEIANELIRKIDCDFSNIV